MAEARRGPPSASQEWASLHVLGQHSVDGRARLCRCRAIPQRRTATGRNQCGLTMPLQQRQWIVPIVATGRSGLWLAGWRVGGCRVLLRLRRRRRWRRRRRRRGRVGAPPRPPVGPPACTLLPLLGAPRRCDGAAVCESQAHGATRVRKLGSLGRASFADHTGGSAEARDQRARLHAGRPKWLHQPLRTARYCPPATTLACPFALLPQLYPFQPGLQPCLVLQWFNHRVAQQRVASTQAGRPARQHPPRRRRRQLMLRPLAARCAAAAPPPHRTGLPAWAAGARGAAAGGPWRQTSRA